MIDKIIMKNCATYNEEGVSIDNCKKVNFFYGPNGSGKSTISNYLYKPNEPLYSSCEIKWGKDEPTDIIVYNKEFRNRHLKEDIDGVFTLGEATIEETNALEELKDKREKKKKDLAIRKNSLKDKRIEKQNHKNHFRDTIWNVILKGNEDDFQEAFNGFRGNKEKFYNEVISRYKKSHITNKTRESLQKKSKTLFSKKPESYSLVDVCVEELIRKLNTIEENTIWRKIVVGNKDVPVSRLIEYLDNADWVNKGRTYIKSDGICPFCQQKTITKDLEQQLNSFFNGEYQKDTEIIKNLIEEYRIASSSLMSILENIKNNNIAITIGLLDISKYDTLLDSLRLLFSNSINEMALKEKEPGRIIILSESNSKIKLLLDMIGGINQNIDVNNKMVDNYNSEKKALIDDIWEYLMDEQEALIKSYLDDKLTLEKAEAGIEKGIDRIQEEINKLDEEIYESGKNITSVQPTVDEINRSLRSYGFTNFRIVPSPTRENFYQIQRLDGTLATNTLSEGEETFISFLYFLQFAKGSTDATKVSSKKILIIDDPICSLDSTVLYIVSSMVKSLIKDVREDVSDVEQIFILTHNVFFHKEASFIDGRTKEVKDINYWIISKDNNISSIISYGMKNPIKTSYELLWQELKDNKNVSIITIQNVMRRIIENYFGILGVSIDETIINSFESIEDQITCRSLISWINDGSHSIPDDLYIDSYTDSVTRYKKIFKEVFVKMDHKAHYDMMMGE